jgi:2-polyprenyl-3-methyl-5-hydroxy-6-metoxy-1,4-benzoquinol methylase
LSAEARVAPPTVVDSVVSLGYVRGCLRMAIRRLLARSGTGVRVRLLPRLGRTTIPAVSQTLIHAAGRVHVDELGDGRREISLELADPDADHGGTRWETKYPLDLIESVLAVKGLWVCDEIRRDEDPSYVQRNLKHAVLGYVNPGAFVGKRILDLGCGCGSSGVNLTRLIDSDVEIVGVDLEQEYVNLAKKRARYYGMVNLSFFHSPDGQSLPEGVSDFDFIVLSAVYEHLLPGERAALLPMLWGHLKPSGVLFINGLPHRYSPVDQHTTGLPLINYLPDKLAHRYAVAFSPRVERGTSWETLLRRGIRGGTANEILGILGTAAPEEPMLLEPNQSGMRDPDRTLVPALERRAVGRCEASDASRAQGASRNDRNHLRAVVIPGD